MPDSHASDCDMAPVFYPSQGMLPLRFSRYRRWDAARMGNLVGRIRVCSGLRAGFRHRGKPAVGSGVKQPSLAPAATARANSKKAPEHVVVQEPSGKDGNDRQAALSQGRGADDLLTSFSMFDARKLQSLSGRLGLERGQRSCLSQPASALRDPLPLGAAVAGGGASPIRVHGCSRPKEASAATSKPAPLPIWRLMPILALGTISSATRWKAVQGLKMILFDSMRGVAGVRSY